MYLAKTTKCLISKIILATFFAIVDSHISFTLC